MQDTKNDKIELIDWSRELWFRPSFYMHWLDRLAFNGLFSQSSPRD